MENPFRLFGVLLAVLLIFGLAGCGDDDENGASAGPEVGDDVEDVREDDVVDTDLDFGFDDDFEAFENEALVGEQVTVSAEVSEVFSPSTLAIAGEGGPSAVLVIAQNRDIVPVEVSDNAVISVTGTVAELLEIETFDEFETEFEEFGPFGFEADDEAFFESDELDEFEGDRFIIASEITVLDATEDGDNG